MRIALLAPFRSFSDTYSLSHVVLGQYQALKRAGHEVRVWCIKPTSGDPPTGMALRFGPDIVGVLAPHTHENDKVCPARVQEYADNLVDAIDDFVPDAIITHDAIFQAGYIDFAAAIHDIAAKTIDIRWFHFIHSAIASPPPPILGDQKYRRTIPPGHTVIYPNKSFQKAVAAYYSIDESRVRHCPNPRDPLTVWGMSDLAVRIIESHRILDRDIVQVYPFCATRIEAKGVRQLVAIFDQLKGSGQDVMLILAPSSANGEREKAALRSLIAECQHLTPDDLLITSLEYPTQEHGIPHATVMDLMRVSNVFVFPTLAEACPLVMAEAMLAGNVIACNVHCPAVAEFAPSAAIRFGLPAMANIEDFSATFTRRGEGGEASTSTTLKGKDAFDAVVKQIASDLVNIVRFGAATQAKRTAFRTFSLPAIGRQLDAIITE